MKAGESLVRSTLQVSGWTCLGGAGVGRGGTLGTQTGGVRGEIGVEMDHEDAIWTSRTEYRGEIESRK